MPVLANSAVSPIGKMHAGVFGISERTGLFSTVEKNLVAGWEGHYGWQNPPPYSDVGGAFILYGSESNNGVMNVGQIRAIGPYSDFSYEGKIVGRVTPLAVPTVGLAPDSWMAEAYSKMKPTAPSFQASNAIFELREVPEMLRQKMVNGPLRNMSNYWLALQFGWKPLLNDIRNSVLTQMGMQNRLNQLLRDEGKPVRRRIALHAFESEPVVTSGEAYGSFDPGDFVSYFYSSPPTHTTTEYTLERVWATAQFRYWLPPGPRDIKWTASMKQAIFGLDVSPKTLYNAIPWSWLYDWYTNTGYVLDNLSSGVADRLAADYFYCMSERQIVRESEFKFNAYDMEFNPVQFQTTSTAKSYSKMRSRGDPFGGAFNEESLSAMQLSILGSLGRSRL